MRRNPNKVIYNIFKYIFARKSHIAFQKSKINAPTYKNYKNASCVNIFSIRK